MGEAVSAAGDAPSPETSATKKWELESWLPFAGAVIATAVPLDATFGSSHTAKYMTLLVPLTPFCTSISLTAPVTDAPLYVGATELIAAPLVL